jgi:hypothetical protein
MTINRYQKVCLTFFLFLTIFWITLFIHESEIGFYNYLYSFLFGLMPLIGGTVAILKSKQWSGFKSATGRAIFFIGLGILLWGVGAMIWAFYNFFLNVPAPYPSLADIGFASSIFFYGLGAIYLSSVTGAQFGFKNRFTKLFVAIGIIILPILYYYIIIIVIRNGVIIPAHEPLLKIILDIAYPLGDFFGLSTALLIFGLSFKYIGGLHKYNIISIISGLAIMFIADTIFSYTTNIGTFYNGDKGDFVLTIGLFLLTFGVLGLLRSNE